jgi:non-ribosomal peptide synthetase component F
VTVISVEDLSPAQREERALALAREEGLRPFDLARGPLLRLVLVRLAPEECLLLLTLHHIVCDGWSIGVLVRELTALYAALLDGRSSPLPELPVQYADYAHWQRRWAESDEYTAQLDYWRAKLRAAPPITALPLARPRPPVQSFRGARVPIALDEAQRGAVERLAREGGATAFMVLLAAWKVLLSGYAGEDLVVGAPLAHRTHSEVEGLIGFFINTVVLRTDLGDDPTFRAALSRVRAVTLEAQLHQDLPFDRLVDELVPRRDLTAAPLYQVTFVMANTPSGPLELPGLTLRVLDLDYGITHGDLMMNVWEHQGGFAGWLVYNANLFDAAVVERMAARYGAVIDLVGRNPELKRSEVLRALAELDEREARERHEREEREARGRLGAIQRRPVRHDPSK